MWLSLCAGINLYISISLYAAVVEQVGTELLMSLENGFL